ncbi:hypothetical protein F4780DRAFT_745483 [Xylariomycetidae sp. FL0641]|nr:hypothetical protein F4780DRAFT_745483 [Xylariomycetidae sp. FL0641]
MLHKALLIEVLSFRVVLEAQILGKALRRVFHSRYFGLDQFRKCCLNLATAEGHRMSNVRAEQMNKRLPSEFASPRNWHD